MGYLYPYIKPLLVTLFMISLMAVPVKSQVISHSIKDTAAPAQSRPQTLKDSLHTTIDTALRNAEDALRARKDDLLNKSKSKLKSLTTLPRKEHWINRDTAAFDLNNPFRHLLTTKPLVRLTGGYISYQFNYRSAIDTPYVEKNIAQHNITGNLFLTVAGHLPLRVTWWSRQSNSKLFRDITDVQASFDANAFQQQLQGSLRQRLLAMAPRLSDSLTAKLYELKKLRLGDLHKTLQTSFSPQSLVEAHEVLHVPRITWQAGLPDSVNIKREESLKKTAGMLLDLYAKTKGEYDHLSGEVDSLKKVYEQNQVKVQQFRKMVGGQWNELVNTRRWKDKLQEYGMDDVEVPAKYRWLLGLRQFSVGRSVTNYSELTVKNTSVNGINVEYNSWYYFAVAAGLVDYRYRDFVVNGSNKKPQYLYLVRAGLGRLEKNYFILSAFRGQKQLFPSNGSGLSVITVTGFSAAAKMQLNRNSYVTAEVAKSLAPDFRTSPQPPPSGGGAGQPRTKFDLSDHTNQAYALKAYSYIPAWGTRLEGFYKHTGANFQSFSSFQTNNAQESWTVKAEQPFFKRRLKLAGSLRKNEFTNPFLPQSYSSNTVFKSLTATFRMRKWPVITIGYQPMSQLTALDTQVIENKFQSLNASAYHMYKIGTLRTASTLILNKFYNNNRDTGFIYYNATNVFGSQQFFFNAFTAQVGVAYTSNGTYRLVVMDEGIQLNLTKLGSVGFGVKINTLNDETIKTGGYVNANLRVFKQDFITMSYESGYLPGFNKGLIRNDMATVQFVKSF